jgi:hypothetical protein
MRLERCSCDSLQGCAQRARDGAGPKTHLHFPSGS